MKDSESNSQPWYCSLVGVSNAGLFLAGMANLGVGTHAAYSGSATLAATCLAAGLVLLFAATIDRFESLKGLGIEAKTRQLDKKIEEADEALRRLRQLAELSGSSLISISSKLGSWNSAPSPREAYDLAMSVKAIMQSLGFDHASVSLALDPWVRATCRDIAATVVNPLLSVISKRHPELKDRRRLLSTGAKNDPEFLEVTAACEAIDSFFKDHSVPMFRGGLETDGNQLLALIDAVPAVFAQETATIATRARQLVPVIDDLRDNLRIQNPEALFAAIEQYRKS